MIKAKTTDEILKEYDEQETESVDNDASSQVIPDDTMDQLIADIPEGGSAESGAANEHETNENEDSTNLLEMEVSELKATVENYRKRLEESEESTLNSQIEVSSLTDKIHQLENEMKNKDDQNLLLLGEKNSMEMKNNEVEAKLVKIDAAIQKIYNEKETLKAQIEKQKTTIDFLQNKSPSLSNSAASEAIKKLNESMKVKTGEVTNLKQKNKQLAEVTK